MASLLCPDFTLKLQILFFIACTSHYTYNDITIHHIHYRSSTLTFCTLCAFCKPLYQNPELYGQHPVYPVVIDRQTGSQLADGKRSRNARASHRFRERRKAEWEDLKQQVRELKKQNEQLETQRDFYKARYVGDTPPPSTEIDAQNQYEYQDLTAEEEESDSYELGNRCRVYEPL